MRGRLLIVVCLAAIAAQPAGGEVRLRDDAGRTIVLPQPASRIIGLAPFLTELLYAAGAGERVIAGVEYSDYPPAAATLPRVGNYKKFDVERILALAPDLLIAWISGNPRSEVATLERMGLRVLHSEPRSLEDIARTLRLLGRAAGTARVAEQAAADFGARLAALQRAAVGETALSVFYQVWNDPLITVNGAHLISDVLRRCGGRNVFAHLPNLAPRVDTEAVLRADPQVIIASGERDGRPRWLDDWRRWPELAAVRDDNLYFVPPALIQRHTPRILQGMQTMCEQLALARAKARAPQ